MFVENLTWVEVGYMGNKRILMWFSEHMGLVEGNDVVFMIIM